MAPILIDSRDLMKLGFVSALTVFFVFAAGFFSGHQRAESFYLATSELESLSLPEKIASIESDITSQIPETMDVGEEIDVDQPEPKSNKIAVNKGNTKISNAEDDDSPPQAYNQFDDAPILVKPRINIESENIKVVDVKTSLNIINEVDSSKSFKNKISDNNNDADVVEEYQAVVVSELTPDELDKIKYSIQVGMYGRLINAENMMEILQEQQFNAYVSDYTNKKNEVRYNVRFGYFMDKKAALSALGKYKKNQNGDGYLVKFSLEKIINLATASNINKSVIIEESSKNLIPETKQQDVIRDEISPPDPLSSTNVLVEPQAELLAKTQIETLAN